MKNIIVLIIALSVSSFSFFINRREKIRINNLEKCLLMFEQMETKMIYSYDDVFSMIKDISEGYKLCFLKSFLLSDKNQTLEYRWKNSLENSKYNDCFKSEDIRILSSFGKMFGITDCQGQIKNCAVHRKLLQDVYSRAEQKNAKRGNLITTLGVMASLGIIVLFI